jgi:lipopolysaccharide export system protein LptA
MACKFRAAMTRLFPYLLLAVLAFGAGGAAAEKADRGKPLNVESDQPGRIDLANQIVVFNGNVVVTKGTMVIRAGRIEVRESPDGYHSAVAIGTPEKPATFQQKRDGVDETIEGEAERLEYDARADTIRFVGNAVVRRLRGATVADELSGQVVAYDNAAEVFSISGGAPGTANPTGRVRAVLSPRPGTAAAADAASVPLTPSPALKDPPR